ncbi:hypothetical protein H6769_02300 [Candidatus Peribacteria bacterium]|nr:hypothetical protein [Candidatus Peribacteria bacterium]
MTNALHLTIGAEHTCVLKSDNTVECWGEDSE